MRLRIFLIIVAAGGSMPLVGTLRPVTADLLIEGATIARNRPATAETESRLLSREELRNAPVFYSLEAALEKPTEVLRLDLSADTTRRQLPASIGQLENLQELVLKDVPLQQLPAALGHLRYLQILNISHLEQPNEAMVKLPDAIEGLQHLRYVNLIGNPNLDFPQTFRLLAKLPGLQILAIMNNRLTELPDEIKNLKPLRQIWMGKNPDLDLSGTFEKLQALELTHVGLGGNGHDSIPETFTGLAELELFYLAGNPIEKLPDMSGMKQLEAVNLSRFGLDTLPEGLETIQSLRVLILEGNPGLDFQKAFLRLKSFSALEVLSLANSDLTSVPSGIEQLEQLKTLHLTGNSLPEAELARIRELLPNTRIEH